METVELLQQIGLNKYEAEAYYVLLTHGPLTGYEVGKYSRVPGSRSYEVLERLLEKGLVLMQPGEPPRYRALDPHTVVDCFRSTMETTLTTLALSLTSLRSADTTDEYWVVRGQQNVLAQVQSSISNARETLNLKLSSRFDVAESLRQARTRNCRIFLVPAEEQSNNSVLLLSDERVALVGTLVPRESCQAVLTSNAALIEVLHEYFFSQQPLTKAVSETSTSIWPSQDVHWIDWEARKQRTLSAERNEPRVA